MLTFLQLQILYLISRIGFFKKIFFQFKIYSRYILSVVLKAHNGPFSFGILVKLFYECFPLKLMVDFSSTKMFISSGSLTNDGKSLGASELEAFLRLSSHHKQTMVNSVEVAERFKAFSSTHKPTDVLSSKGPSFLVELANRYNIIGGYWIMFFQDLDISQREGAFNLLLESAYKNWGPISRFNAKISSDNFIICFGNKLTTSIMNPANLDSSRRKTEVTDPGALKVRQIVDKIYAKNCYYFGSMHMKCKGLFLNFELKKYFFLVDKPDIMRFYFY
ncbi:unnamed protein product [Meloidogyne enterolobii]|uniref:Uncharacterized protein n=2 Tax=Meloidogyne enterolobii TaxID=390850 RepID=A0ACB0XN51_MELEN